MLSVRNPKLNYQNYWIFFSVARPDLFEYNTLLRNSSRGNLEHAFNVANTHLGVPMLLDPEGMYRTITYLSSGQVIQEM